MGEAGIVPPGLREKVERTLLDSYAPACLAVDSRNAILYTSGQLEPYFGAPPAFFADLFAVSPRDLVAPLRALFARIDDDPGRPARQKVFIGEAGARRPIELVVWSLAMDRGGPIRLVVIEDPAAPAKAAGSPVGGMTGGTDRTAAPPLTSPAETVSTSAAAPAAAKEEEPGGAERILVIEDHLDAAEGMRLLLELKGYHVAVAHDGPAGIEKARQFRPAIVLCDIGLPGGMDGYQVAREFRNDVQLKSSALVALTGYGQEKDQAHALEAGFDAHMTKPADPAALIRLINTLPRRT